MRDSDSKVGIWILGSRIAFLRLCFPPPTSADHVGDVNAVFSLDINGDFWDFGPWLKYCQPLSHPDAPLVSVMRNH